MDDYQILIDFIKQLFTPEQQIALGIMTITVMALVEYYKNISPQFLKERKSKFKRMLIWRAALFFGLCTGVGGYFIGQPPQPLWFWAVSGILVGVVGIYAYKILVEWLLLKVRNFRQAIKNWINK